MGKMVISVDDLPTAIYDYQFPFSFANILFENQEKFLPHITFNEGVQCGFTNSLEFDKD